MKSFQTHEKNLAEIDVLVNLARQSLGQQPPNLLEANAITRSGLVLLCGFFEGFIRELFKDAVIFINDLNPKIDGLPRKLQRKIVDEGLQKSQWDEKFVELEKLFRLIRGNGIFELREKFYSDTGGNPTPDTIDGLFSVFGLGEIVDKLSINHYGIASTYSTVPQFDASMMRNVKAKLDGYLDVSKSDEIVSDVVNVVSSKWVPKRKRRNVGFFADINEFLRKRNIIAHGDHHIDVTPDELADLRLMVHNFSKGLHDEMSNVLNGIPTP